jgi:hypothetical protein
MPAKLPPGGPAHVTSSNNVSSRTYVVRAQSLQRGIWINRSPDHGLGTVEKIPLTCFDRLIHARHRMLPHEPQNLYEPTGASDRTVDLFQFGAEVAEARTELSVPEGERVAQRS